MKIGYIGLGRMGKNMVFRLLEQGVEIVAWNRSPGPREEVESQGAETVLEAADIVSRLEPPRTIWIMLPSGDLVDEFIDQLAPLLAPGDLLIDGGNSFYQDSIRRGEKLAKFALHFMDIGTSGGPHGARTGACLMIGGSVDDFKRIKELVQKIAAPNAYGHLGPVGAGHFAKMVHNGIEYGMMESIAEGVQMLKQSRFQFNLAEVLRVYNNRSVIESRLVGWLEEALWESPNLDNVSSKIGATGEGEWTIQIAKELGVEVPAIEDAFRVRQRSSEESNNFRDQAVSAMRGKFGQHKVGKG